MHIWILAQVRSSSFNKNPWVRFTSIILTMTFIMNNPAASPRRRCVRGGLGAAQCQSRHLCSASIRLHLRMRPPADCCVCEQRNSYLPLCKQGRSNLGWFCIIAPRQRSAAPALIGASVNLHLMHRKFNYASLKSFNAPRSN